MRLGFACLQRPYVQERGFRAVMRGASSHHGNILLPVLAHPRDGYRIDRHAQVRIPKLLAGVFIEGTEFSVSRIAYKHQAACGDNGTTTGQRCSCWRHPKFVEFRKRPKGNLPRKLAGIHIHSNQTSPRRLLAWPSFGSVPKIVAQFGWGMIRRPSRISSVSIRNELVEVPKILTGDEDIA